MKTKLSYKDHIHTCCINLYLSYQSIVDPRNLGNGSDALFQYYLQPDFAYLKNQAIIFGEELSGNSYLINKMAKECNIKKNQRESSLQAMYIYSYIRALKVIENFNTLEQTVTAVQTPGSKVFYGHKLLTHVFVEINSQMHHKAEMGGVRLNKELYYSSGCVNEGEVAKELVKTFNEEYPYYKLTERKGNYNNTELNTLFDYLSSYDDVVISSLDDISDINYDPLYNPLGNCCFVDKGTELSSSDEKDTFKIGTVYNQESVSDYISKFWNLACCIFREESCECPTPVTNFDNVYMYHDAKNFNSKSSYAMYAIVQSITGLDCKDSYSYFGKKELPGGGSNGNDPEPVNPKGDNPFKPDKKKQGNKSNNNNKKALAKIANAIKDAAVKTGDSIMRSELPNIIQRYAAAEFDRKLKKNELESLINMLESKKFVVKDHNIHGGFFALNADKSRREFALHNADPEVKKE